MRTAKTSRNTTTLATTRRGLLAAAALAPLLLALGAMLASCADAPRSPEARGDPAAVPRRPAAADPADWCAGHGVPESMCTVCNPALVARFRAANDWCAEHGYPESVCPSCHPLAPPGAATGRAAPGGDADDHGDDHAHGSGGGDGAHGDVPARDGDDHAHGGGGGGDGGPAPSPALAAWVRVRSPALERAAGIETAPAEPVAVGVEVETTARVDFDRNAMADVRSAVPGIVREVAVDLGQRVAAGEALFVLESAAVGDLQARRAASRERVAAARANLVRQEALRADAVASQRALDVARQEREEAEADLRSIDSSLRISGASSGRRAGGFVVRSPIAGQVLRRPALVGSYAGEADSLATVADTTTMWVLLDVPEDAAPAVRVGHEVEIEVAGLPGRAFAGRVTWIASEVAARTRTVEARAEVQNDDGLLRAGQFARARVRVEAPRGAVAVPTAAVQRRGDESIVFVRVGEGTYEPRVVVPGRAAGPLLEVEGPVRAGDAVVTTGAFLLRTELDRGAIGSGCCETGRAGGG